MEIIMAKTAGFCFGVSRAVDTVSAGVEKHQEEEHDPNKN